MGSRAAEIYRLCDQWVAASATPEGGMQIGESTEQHRLLANGVVFHDLDHEELRAACVGLTTVLLRPGLNTVVNLDHQWFWSWCGELLAGSRSTYFAPDEHELQALFGLAVRASLAGIIAPTPDAWERHRQASEQMEPNAFDFVVHAHAALPYLAFPLLEGVAKKSLTDYVSPDGTVLKQFSVARSNGRTKTYRPTATCSSVADLLRLVYAETATSALKSDLDKQCQHLEVFRTGSGDGFDVLYRWRNASLHGAAALPTIGGTVLNTAILIALDAVKDDYGAMRDRALASARWEVETASLTSGNAIRRSPWSYYPPYI